MRSEATTATAPAAAWRAALAQRLRPLIGSWRRATAALDARPPRERAALGAMAVAALVALELLVVWPIRDQRGAVVGAVQAQLQADAAARQALQEQQEAEASTWQARLIKAERELRNHGHGHARGEALGTWLQRALADQAVALVALRDLGVQEAETPAAAAEAHPAAPAAASSAAAPAAATTPAGTSAATAEPAALPLFRLRYELTLDGDVASLTAAVQALGQRMRPLRIERLRVAAGVGGVGARATLVFVIVTPERAWISL